MSVEYIYYCDNLDCGKDREKKPTSIRTATPPPYVPRGILSIVEGATEHHFCSWDCIIKYAWKEHSASEYVEGS